MAGLGDYGLKLKRAKKIGRREKRIKEKDFLF
jgi:hypothetical protein